YVWMEAGTNAFSDTTFTSDADPDASNSSASTAHLATQMMAANPAVTWLSFQEGLNSSTGACPISSSGFYAAKHDPFVFFQDIVGRTPSASASVCVAHHRAYATSTFAQAMAGWPATCPPSFSSPTPTTASSSSSGTSRRAAVR